LAAEGVHIVIRFRVFFLLTKNPFRREICHFS
jgi:hypothetical protein